MRNRIFEKVPIKVPRRSGFDLSHETRGTAKVGILVPVMTREMQGHDSLSVNLGSQVQFAPFATDFYGRVKVYFEAFFVPYRIIDGNYKDLYRYSLAKFAGQQAGTGQMSADDINTYFEGLIVHQRDAQEHHLVINGSDVIVPALTTDETADPSVGLIGQGTLLDYLGVKTSRGVYTRPNEEGISTEPAPLRLNNIHRLSAYHRIYEEYYMDSRIQNHAFQVVRNGVISSSGILRSTPYRVTPVNNGNKYWIDNGLSESSLALLGDGFNICGLRSRLYSKDYFTTATTDPQFGGEMGFTVDENGRATIAQVRAANSLQQYCELHNKVGNHYDDLAFALTGIRPSDAAVDIPIYLGRQVYDVYNKSVYQTVQGAGDEFSQNPFNSVASKYANGQALGSGHLCDFTATEGGIFMVLMSVAPEASYGSGSSRQWDYDTIFDLPTPQLQGIGDQPIYDGELKDSEYQLFGSDVTLVPINRDNVFGYTQRYAEAKFMLDETHANLRDDMSLSAFALKRSFAGGSTVELGKQFLQVPITALDEVSALASNSGGNSVNPQSLFGYWYDIYFDVKLVSNLSAYSIPTLEDMDGNTVMTDNGGRRL